MRRLLPLGWRGTCLLAVLLTCGCQHPRTCCSPCDANPVTMGAPVVAKEAPALTPALDVPSGVGEAAAPAANIIPPVVRTTANIPAVDPMLNLAPPPHSSLPSGAAARGQFDAISYQESPQTEPAPRRLAGDGQFAHDANYQWLVGTVDYSRIQQAWVLRYVPVEEEDRYGGCVTLVTNRPMNFKQGQTLRVQGALIDPDSQQLRPAFQVQDIRAEQP